METIIVYHMKAKNTLCFDGFLAASLLWRKYKDTATYIPAFYFKRLPIETFVGNDVIFVDFSYPVEYMDAISVVANSLLVLDHHETAKPLIGKPYAVINQSVCGSALTWMYLYPQVEMPPLVKYVNSGDLYIFDQPNTEEFHAALAIQDKDFSAWSNLLHMDESAVERFIESGRTLLKLINTRVDEITAEAFPITICGITGLAANGVKAYSTQAGAVLAERSKTFGAVFCIRHDGEVEISLRSIDLDVETMARSFGGGGHVHAAAFSVPVLNFISMFDSHADSLVQIHMADVALDAFGAKIPALPDTRAETIETALLEHFGGWNGLSVGDISVRTFFRSTASDPKTMCTIVTWLLYMLGVPVRTHEKKWYHFLRPFTVTVSNVFDEQEIKTLLNKPRTDDGSVDSAVADALLNTVKPQYTATLCIQEVCEVVVNLPNHQMRIQRSFEI